MSTRTNVKRSIVVMICLAAALLATNARAATPAITAEERAAVLKPVHAWVHAFSTQQKDFPSDAFTDDCTVIDEFAPFAWSAGTTNIRQWYAAVEGLDSPANRDGVIRSKESVSVGDVENLVISGDGAYMTFHATWSANGRGSKMFTQHGLFTVVERRTPNGWRISANSWGILPN
jgi:ketosteroid isomerase-like protein